MKKIKVGILGATGSVGQRFITLLENHPWFEVTALAASSRSAGKTYEKAVAGRWNLTADIPAYARKIVVQECKPDLDCRLVFSGLDSEIAGEIEVSFRKAGYAVSSNSRNHRMDDDVPLMIPEVNADHLGLVEKQKEKYNGGFIITNPNCSTIGMVLALAPIHKQFGITKIFVTTMQALSGAGFSPGVPSMGILDNVIPYIDGEEGKMETETLKLLGTLKGEHIVNTDISVSAQCNRVGTSDGHLETVNVELGNEASVDEIKKAMRDFNPLKDLKLPSSPAHPIVVREEDNRPQPRLDRMEGDGMSAVVGRVREDNILDFKMHILSHNTIRGAAGCSILNAELLKVKGFLS